MMSYDNVLVAVDLAEGSQAFTDKAFTFATAVGKSVYAVHAVPPLPSYASINADDIESNHISSAKQELHQLGQPYNISDDNFIIHIGSSRKVILTAAKEVNAGLIIVGSHTRVGVERLIGSTASAVNNHATCDVYTIRYARG